MVAAVLFISLVVFIFLNIPISISLGLSSVLALIASGSPLGVIPSMMQATVQKFSLLTIPLFVLAGVLMDKGGISKRLINLADSMMGPVHGGLGYISVICALFCGNLRFRYSNRSSYGIYTNSGYGKTGI